MKKTILTLTGLLISALAFAEAGLQPYLLAHISDQNAAETAESIKTGLANGGFAVVGQYKPAEEPKRRILAVSHPALLDTLSALRQTAGFLAAIHIGITEQGGKSLVTLQNPEYWGNAYLQDEYPQAEKTIKQLTGTLAQALGNNEPPLEGFGSTQGFSAEDLREYHYMFGMEYFEDQVELGEFESYENAVSTVEKNLGSSTLLAKVFSQELPGKEVKLYGVELRGETGEGHFMPIIDIADRKHTAFLPYEVLVMGKQVRMLHGRFRIAISFPDLTMGTFGNIMSTPGDIEDLMETLVQK